MNSFISNFKKILPLLNFYKALLLGLSLFVLSQYMFLMASDITQTASKQVVKEKRSWARAKGFMKAEPAHDLIFFFGNSHIAAGIIPDVFDAANNNSSTSYNLSLVGLQMPVHYFLLKDYLLRNAPPPYIFINPVFQGFDVESFPSYCIQGARLQEVLLYAYYRKNLDVFFNYIFPARVHWPETVRYITGKILNLMPPKIKEIHKNLYLGRFGEQEVWGHNRPYFYESQFVRPEELRRERIALLRKQRGYYYIIEESIIGGHVTDKFLKKLGFIYHSSTIENQSKPQHKIILSKADAPSLIDPLSEKFFQLAQKENIKVILMPNYIMSHYRLKCAKLPCGEDISGPDVYPYLHNTYHNVYSLFDQDKIEYPIAYFSDPSHLNPQGAKIYTQEMAQAFKQLKEKLNNKDSLNN